MNGFRVYSLTDYNENVLVMIKRHRPKLVLMDCWLSSHSGKQMCEWIKAHFQGLPVVALSCDIHIDQHYKELGFDDYLKKPFDLDQLYKVVSKQLVRQKGIHSNTAINRHRVN
jgi:DNA-binding response OmpR family regulator